MTPLRCAAYARFSSDRQSPTSIADQIRKCREFAQQRGWTFLDGHVYTDEAISGTTADRAGLQRLLAAATSPARPFGCILIDDTSRLARKQSDALKLYERLQFAGVRLVFVSQGIDTGQEQAEVLMGVHGLVDSLYIRELRSKVVRGMEGKALAGLHTGGRCFGYKSSPIEDPTRTDNYGRPAIVGVRLVVDETEAETVRRIFQLYADGYSLKRVSRLLNSEGVPSPRPQAGRVSRSWCPSSVRKILTNPRYRGEVIWGATRKLRSPESGKRIYRRKQQAEWTLVNLPEQRIVSDELWRAVELRRVQVQVVY
ncbi:MAG: recombinase family protein, partial [Acidobacteria bacterium]|nr:recombinase family protein [Acidobacteriota bacterium]